MKKKSCVSRASVVFSWFLLFFPASFTHHRWRVSADLIAALFVVDHIQPSYLVLASVSLLSKARQEESSYTQRIGLQIKVTAKKGCVRTLETTGNPTQWKEACKPNLLPFGKAHLPRNPRNPKKGSPASKRASGSEGKAAVPAVELRMEKMGSGCFFKSSLLSGMPENSELQAEMNFSFRVWSAQTPKRERRHLIQ